MPDIAQNRLDMAQKLGADYPLLVDTKDAQEMAKKVHAAMGCEPNISIECSGAEQSVQTGVYVSIQDCALCECVGVEGC